MKKGDIVKQINQSNGQIQLTHCTVDLILQITGDSNKEKARKFLANYNERRMGTNRYNDRFKTWLESPYSSGIQNEVMFFYSNAGINLGGRPVKSFKGSSDRTKRRKIQFLSNSESSKLLIRSFLKKYEAGCSPLTLKNFNKCASLWNSSNNYTAVEALSLLFNTNMSVKSYKYMRMVGLLKNNNVYPEYNLVLEEKKKCYTPEIEYTELYASIDPISLLLFTVRRLSQSQNLIFSNKEIYTIHLKYGCDGMSTDAIYK